MCSFLVQLESNIDILLGGYVKKKFFGDPLKRFQIVSKAHKKILVEVSHSES